MFDLEFHYFLLLVIALIVFGFKFLKTQYFRTLQQVFTPRMDPPDIPPASTMFGRETTHRPSPAWLLRASLEGFLVGAAIVFFLGLQMADIHSGATSPDWEGMVLFLPILIFLPPMVFVVAGGAACAWYTVRDARKEDTQRAPFRLFPWWWIAGGVMAAYGLASQIPNSAMNGHIPVGLAVVFGFCPCMVYGFWVAGAKINRRKREEQ